MMSDICLFLCLSLFSLYLMIFAAYPFRYSINGFRWIRQWIRQFISPLSWRYNSMNAGNNIVLWKTRATMVNDRCDFGDEIHRMYSGGPEAILFDLNSLDTGYGDFRRALGKESSSRQITKFIVLYLCMLFLLASMHQISDSEKFIDTLPMRLHFLFFGILFTYRWSIEILKLCMRVPLSSSIRSAVYSAALFHSQSICSTIQRFTTRSAANRRVKYARTLFSREKISGNICVFCVSHKRWACNVTRLPC
jgi:uncharacterized Tic20 family protein